jgi:N-acetylglucosaminyl-diphospho-decaprenol L-rhamnosyltransferase
MIYFVTVNYYSSELISKLINSLPGAVEINYKMIIINNSPDDDSLENLTCQNVLIIEAGCNLGFGSACNLGLKWIYSQDTNAVVWIINPDAYFVGKPSWELGLFFSRHPEISILGTIIRTPNNETWFGGGCFFPRTGSIKSCDLISELNADYVECNWVSGCSLIVNLGNFSECPLFDPVYFLYYEDFDFCQRYAQEGHKITVTKLFEVVHQPSSITNRYAKQKMLHSTYSYLITLERYTNTLIFILRLIRLLSFSIILLFIQPDAALGKIQAVFMYWRDRLRVNFSGVSY